MSISEKQMIANRNNCLKSTGPKTSEGKWVVSQNAIKHGLRSNRVIIAGEDRLEYEAFRNDLLEQLSPCGLLESHQADQIAACLWRLGRTARIESEMMDHLQSVCKKKFPSYFAPPPRQLRYKTYDEARDAWLKTDEGRMYLEKRWPSDPECPTPIETFNKFWKNTFADEGEHLQKEEFAQNSDNTNVAPQQSDVAQPPSAVFNVDFTTASNTDAVETVKETTDKNELFGPVVAMDLAGDHVLLKFSRYETHLQRTLYRTMAELQKLQSLRKRNEAILQAPSVSDGIEVLHDNNAQTTLTGQSGHPEPAKPNEAIYNVSESPVASATGGPSAVSNVTEASLLRSDSMG